MKKYDFELPIDPDDIPKEVYKWIARLRRCFEDAPPGLWFSAGTTGLDIVALDKNGKKIEVKDRPTSLDSTYIIASVGSNVDIDGGDPW